MSSTHAPSALWNHHPTACGELYPDAVDLAPVRAAHPGNEHHQHGAQQNGQRGPGQGGQ